MNILMSLSLVSALRRMHRRGRWSRADLKQHQDASLRILREHAYARSPFYRRFHQGLMNCPLHDLPVLTKKVMMDNFDELVTDPAVRLKDVEQHLSHITEDEHFLGRYRVNATSGSTGRQGIFLFDDAEWAMVLASFARSYDWARDPSEVPRRMKSASIVSPTPWHMSRRAVASSGAWWLPTLRLYANDPLDSMVERLNPWQPQILEAYPSVVRMLAQEQLKGNLRISPRYVFTGAEVLTQEVRRRIGEAWGTGRVFDVYGATESGSLGAECIHHRGLHLFEDLAVIEVVDRDNRPVMPGVFGAKVLITVLFGRTQPLIRYELSDSLKLSGERCPCGRPFALVSEVQGRIEDSIRFPGAAGGEITVNPAVFDLVLDRLPSGEWQVVQEQDGLYVLLSGTPEGFSDEQLADELRRALASQGVVAPVIIKHVPAIPRGVTGKAPLIKSNLSPRE